LAGSALRVLPVPGGISTRPVTAYTASGDATLWHHLGHQGNLARRRPPCRPGGSPERCAHGRTGSPNPWAFSCVLVDVCWQSPVGPRPEPGPCLRRWCAVILEEPRHHRRAALPPVPPPRRNGPAHWARGGRNVRDKAERAGSTRGQGFPVRDPRVLVRSRRRGSVPAGARRLWPSLRSIRSESSKARNFAACLTAANGAAARRPRQVCQLRL